MAQVSIFMTFVLAVIFAAIAVSAQVPEMSPAPSPNAGAGFSLPVSGVISVFRCEEMCVSVVFVVHLLNADSQYFAWLVLSVLTEKI